MKPNVGKPDSWFRVIVGIIIIGLGFYFKNWWGAVGVILWLRVSFISARCTAFSRHPPLKKNSNF